MEAVYRKIQKVGVVMIPVSIIIAAIIIGWRLDENTKKLVEVIENTKKLVEVIENTKKLVEVIENKNNTEKEKTCSNYSS